MTSGPLLDLAWAITAIAAFGGSFLRGGTPRLAGGVVCVAWALSLAVDGHDWPRERLLLFAIDLVLTVFLVWMTRTCRAAWLIFTAASAVLLLVNYGVAAIHPTVHPWAFASVSHLWSAFILLGLIWGAVVGDRPRTAAISRP